MRAIYASDMRQKPASGRSDLERRVLQLCPFLLQRHAAQRPAGRKTGQDWPDWRTWLFMGGRGAGKTRAGAEWVRYMALFGGAGRIALVAPTLGDVREVMIEGASGLRNIAMSRADRPRYEVSRRRLVWENGAVAQAFSAEDPDSLRGPQFDLAWCDEVAAWAHPDAAWDTLQMGLRLGEMPQVCATTTPRPIPLLKRLVAGEALVTQAGTRANAENLAPGFVTAVEAAYGASVLGRQELEGELIEDPQGAMWKRGDLERSRVEAAPLLDEVVVAVDPPATSGPRADACGIIVAGVAAAEGFGRKAFVVADGSCRGLSPLDWGARAAALAREFGAREIVAEANQGGEMVRAVLETAGADVPVRLVHARLSKRGRAGPVAARYQAGEVAHVGVMRMLEDEMCSFGAEGVRGSPDRVDALVWAIWALLLERRGRPRVRGF